MTKITIRTFTPRNGPRQSWGDRGETSSMNKPALLLCILISSHKARLRPTWRASYGHRNTPACFQPNVSMLPTRFLHCCSQVLQKSTFYYRIPFLFFSKMSHKEREFIFHCQRSRVHVDSHLVGQRNPYESLWLQSGALRNPGHTPSLRDTQSKVRVKILLRYIFVLTISFYGSIHNNNF